MARCAPGSQTFRFQREIQICFYRKIIRKGGGLVARVKEAIKVDTRDLETGLGHQGQGDSFSHRWRLYG